MRSNYATYEARSREWAGVRLGDRMASLHGQPIVPLDQVGGPYWRRNLAFRQLYLSVYHLNDATAAEYVDALARFRPEVVAGYTSAVHRLARHLLDVGDLGRIRPRAVMVSSECLLPAARAGHRAGLRVPGPQRLQPGGAGGLRLGVPPRRAPRQQRLRRGRAGRAGRTRPRSWPPA